MTSLGFSVQTFQNSFQTAKPPSKYDEVRGPPLETKFEPLDVLLQEEVGQELVVDIRKLSEESTEELEEPTHGHSSFFLLVAKNTLTTLDLAKSSMNNLPFQATKTSSMWCTVKENTFRGIGVYYHQFSLPC